METEYGGGGWEEHCKDAIAVTERDKERQSLHSFTSPDHGQYLDATLKMSQSTNFELCQMRAEWEHDTHVSGPTELL